MKLIKKMIPMVLIAVLVVFMDMITKIWAENTLTSGPIVLINGVLELSFLRNEGAAFGSFQGARFIFMILTVIVLGFIVFVIQKMPADKKYRQLYFCLSLLTGGAIGNLIDRAIWGSVRDFIYFRLINFPVFNVADIAVTISAFWLAILILFVYKDEDLSFLSNRGKVNKA